MLISGFCDNSCLKFSRLLCQNPPSSSPICAERAFQRSLCAIHRRTRWRIAGDIRLGYSTEFAQVFSARNRQRVVRELRASVLRAGLGKPSPLMPEENHVNSCRRSMLDLKSNSRAGSPVQNSREPNAFFRIHQSCLNDFAAGARVENRTGSYDFAACALSVVQELQRVWQKL